MKELIERLRIRAKVIRTHHQHLAADDLDSAADALERLNDENKGLVEGLREVVALLVSTGDFRDWMLDGSKDLSMFDATMDGETIYVVHKADLNAIARVEEITPAPQND